MRENTDPTGWCAHEAGALALDQDVAGFAICGGGQVIAHHAATGVAD
jgi:hypothetical protein